MKTKEKKTKSETYELKQKNNEQKYITGFYFRGKMPSEICVRECVLESVLSRAFEYARVNVTKRKKFVFEIHICIHFEYGGTQCVSSVRDCIYVSEPSSDAMPSHAMSSEQSKSWTHETEK